MVLDIGHIGACKSQERFIKRRTLAVILFLITMLQIGAASAEDQLSGILDGVLKRYGGLRGLTVDYEREIITKSMAILGDSASGDRASGKIHVKPPYFLMIQQERPKAEIVSTDGQTLWWYIPEKNTVHKYPSNRLGKELRLLSDVFQGLSQVGDNFDVILTDLGDNEEYRLKLIPNPPWEEIDHIELSVERKGFTIRVIEIHNIIGTVTRFILGVLSVQDKFNDDFFRFVAPDGVTVIEE